MRPDFKKTNNKTPIEESWYDIEEDWELVEASLATQYHVLRHEIVNMPWDQLCSYVKGFMFETPLGRVVGIRSETDRSAIKQFSPSQRKIHNDWKLRQANKQLEDVHTLDAKMDNLFTSLVKELGLKEGRKNGR